MDFVETPAFINSIWIGSAFLAGFLFKRFNLPPMLGFLLSGFLMNFLGFTGGSLPLEEIADLGILLLLFTIGLKLDIKGLAKAEIWGGATIHAIVTIFLLAALLMGGAAWGFGPLLGLTPVQAALIGFALSFSSTVFAVKVLEEKGEMNALHGRTAIGILIMQDLMAVFFLTVSKGEFPSLWALALPLGLLAVRPLLLRLIDYIGHGELLPFSGFFLALVIGTTSFSLVGLKPDLGALVLGVLVGSHPRALELSHSLYSFKDLLLVGFFFQVGLTGTPKMEHVLIALGLMVVLIIKSFFYFLVLARFHRRARTSLLAALTLSNYSEFGLLVAAIAMQKGWLGPEWLIISALALTFSFLLAAPLNGNANAVYDRLAGFLRRFETRSQHPDDVPTDLGNADVLIFGMGPFGAMAYDTINQRVADKVLAVDHNQETVAAHQQAGRRVIWGDATDYDFWHTIDLDRIKIVMLAISNHQANLLAVQEIKSAGFAGPITATAQFEDERRELEAAGATAAYNIFSEAGAGYADHVCQATGLVCKTEFVVSAAGIPTMPK
ncbi:MAG: cation:proton antiporter family protein [Desulfurivibrio sp.]|nr:cation:proton antiporter family protein [Desulfurivibrio sp.]